MRASLGALVVLAVLSVAESETPLRIRAPLPSEHARRVRAPLSPFALGDGYVYPPLTPTPAPLVVMLHGMWGDARGVCEFWNGAGRDKSWLVCPGGNVPCGGYRDWRGDGATKALHIDALIDELAARHGALIAHDDHILAGFSRGAFVARDVVYARPGRYRGLILLGAALVPDPKRLERAGIVRVVLGAGDLDGARPTMQRAAGVLTRGGIEARYLSLGKIPHALPADLERIMREALSWIREAL